MRRITLDKLEYQVKYLNELTSNPLKPYSYNEGSNIGSYYIQGAYGGYQLQQIVNKGGGCRTLLNTGFTTKKNLFNNINSYLLGIESTKKIGGFIDWYIRSYSYSLLGSPGFYNNNINDYHRIKYKRK